MVAARARRIQAELEALTADVAAVRDEVTGSVQVGVIGSTARWLAPALLEALAVAYPMINVVLHDAATSAQVPLLVTGQIELGVLALPIEDPDVSSVPLFEEESVLLVPATHPLAGRKRLSINDLEGQELLLLPKGTTFRDALDAAANKAGFELLAKAEVDGMRLVATMAFQGFAATIAPASAAPAGITGGWEAIRVDGLPPRHVGLAQRKRSLLSAPSRAFIEVLHSAITDLASSQPDIHVSPDLLAASKTEG